MESLSDEVIQIRRQISWGGTGYPSYEGFLKVSGGEKSAANQTANESQFLQNMMQTQFKEQQDLLNNFLVPQLKSMATNPQGFGAKALADMQSQLISTVGSQYASQEKSLNQQFASANMAGLGSGVQTALQANLAQGAVGMEAGGLQNIQLANEQAKLQQQQFGLSGLAGADQLLGQAPQSADLALKASGQRFDQQYKMAQQGSMWQNLLGGVIGAGLTFATGGLGALAMGGSFLGGGGSALFGSAGGGK